MRAAKERAGRTSVRRLAGASVLLAAALAGGARAEEPGAAAALAAEVARRPASELRPFATSPDPRVRRLGVRAAGRAGGDEGARLAALRLGDAAPEVREEAFFAVGVSGSPLAAGLLEPHLGEKAAAADVAAAATGLANCGDDAAGALLVRLACRDDRPVEAPEAIFRHVRWRQRPWEGGLPDDRLLRYESHPDARGRAGIGWLGRVWKDPKLLPALERLAKDPDAEVRRAAALGLADGKAPNARPAADAARCVKALAALVRDADVRVAVSACRAAASYESGDGIPVLRTAFDQENFHLRTAAAEGLGARKAAAAYEQLASSAQWRVPHGVELATPAPGDDGYLYSPSTSVRFASAKACLAIDPKRAQELVPALLQDPSPFVRTAGLEIAAASEAPDAWRPVVAAAESDPSVLVRETAVSLLGEKWDVPEVRDAVRRALASDDPVVAGNAADVASKRGWTDLAPAIRALLDRHPGAVGADARVGAVLALAKLGLVDDAALLTRAADDADPSVRTNALQALAERAGTKPPPHDRRPRAEGAAMPLGAPALSRDVVLVVETDAGTMRIRLDADAAPVHAAHLADLARKGFYDGLTWHRVVPDFVIQGGCPRGDGSGNAGATLPLEPTRRPFVRGTLGMPRSDHPDTGGCQLFVCHSRAPHLDVQYAAIGQVVEGLDVIDRIDVGSRIVRVRVEEVRTAR